ncbi:MAG: glutamate 5-kinase [Actinomycetota bacterium]|nr:glutamate 5-kinase [Actinomycetota bacterium]
MKKPIKRIVIKVGSSTVADSTGRLDRENMKQLVDQVARLWRQGAECVIVTSGAIAAGVEQLDLKKRPREIAKLQAAAAVGQGLLIHEYTRLFHEHGIQAAQILLTQFDMAHRELYLNARHALDQLLAMRVVPVVNENDTTTVEEIKFGDNDMLAALVAVLIDADHLALLSDIDGLYAGDPRKAEPATKISFVKEITPEIEEMAEGIGSSLGSGGMITKINAAKLVGAARISMQIVDGREPGVLQKIIDGEEVGTYFAPGKRKIPGRKLWLGFSRAVKGRVIIDQGAVKAIRDDGKSLLPAGVVDLTGDFTIGDTIEVSDAEGRVIARGISNYSAVELAAIRGKRTAEIAKEYAGDFSEEIIHRDYMVLI